MHCQAVSIQGHFSLTTVRRPNRVAGRSMGSMPHDQELTRRGLLLVSSATATALTLASGADAKACSLYDLSASQYGREISLSKYSGMMTVVNKNYPGLRRLYEQYRDQGFNLIAFPCNQFAGQAPGTSEEERQYAWKKFGFEFDVFDKIDVNGPNTHPVYQCIKREQPASQGGIALPGGAIEWNYVKAITDLKGRPVKRFGPSFDPIAFEGDVQRLLAGKSPLPRECIAHPLRKACKL